ncbi:MAG: toxin-antitoxin system HicB family antitoxin [Prosthecobacter sp.]|jgi:hypothetical protein|uniref:toxin-antitoxin system HicB family antitoxin n=1 Tax=Prosthecobacter sp. TaxID=1965333 RepID=UPI0019D80229|nr:toxin-antitoxin system HicB family antitoxin [Prosthecobacter sp.]MBE2283940.1 toxin-antitoxin system HicB family antitoxin [Prosthecobacter sp.]
MATLSIDIPDSLRDGIEELTAKDGYSLNQFLVCAAAEKLSSFATMDYLRERAARADFAEFDRIMTRIPNVAPDPGDELP